MMVHLTGVMSVDETTQKASDVVFPITRMHSSRMHTARSSSFWGAFSTPRPGTPPWEQTLPEADPQVWALRAPWLDPPQLPPLGVGLEPPWPDPPKLPLGVGLKTCKACWDTTPSQRPAARHAGIPPAMHAGISPLPLWTE